MNSVLSKITNISIILGTIAIAVVLIWVDYHILWIGPAEEWDLWKKVLIFIAEIVYFVACVFVCIYLFVMTLDDIEAKAENFGRSILALFFCGVLPGVLFWVCMIQDAISNNINWSHHSSSKRYSTSIDDDEDDEEDESSDDEEDEDDKPTDYGIRYHEKKETPKKEKVDKPDSSSTGSKPRRVLKRRSKQ